MRIFITTLILFCGLIYQSSNAADLPVKGNITANIDQEITTDIQASSSLPTNYPPDIARIIKRGTLIVALVNKDVPPFFEVNKNGDLVGYDIGLAQNLAEQLGVKVEFHRGANTYDGVVDEVVKGHADIAISELSVTLPRALRVNFSQPYLYLPLALLYNRLLAAQMHRPNPAVDIINDSTVTLGVLDKSSYLEYIADSYPRAKIIRYTNPQQGMQDVATGKIFGFYSNQVEINSWLQRHPAENLYVNYGLLGNKTDPIAIAVSWQDERLLNWINWYLVVIKENGFQNTLKEQFLTDNAQNNS